jgi:transcriptional regulator GlxA family with amidase domain
MDWRIEKVIRLLRQEGCNLEPRSAITHLAESVNLSASRLRHLFKSETGVSLKKRLIETRLETGRDLLEGSLLTVKEITVRVGYTHASHFVRDFKRVYQVSPAQYRKQHLDEKYQP